MKIACMGNTAYDCTVSGDTFLMEGVRNSFDNAIFSVGGPTSNAASVLAKFGNYVDFYGQIGNDENGKKVYKEMYRENINLNHLNISNDVITPFSFVIINTSDSTRTICSVRSKSDFKQAKIQTIEYENDYDFILTDGKYVQDAINLIEKNPQAISIIDAGRVIEGILNLCNRVNYIICSEDFANEVTGEIIDDNYVNNVRIFRKMQSLFPKAKEIAITIGKRGYICEKNSEVIIMPSYDSGLKAIDTNCAGDIFHGAFTHALAQGNSYHESLEFANVTASLSTTLTSLANLLFSLILSL